MDFFQTCVSFRWLRKNASWLIQVSIDTKVMCGGADQSSSLFHVVYQTNPLYWRIHGCLITKYSSSTNSGETLSGRVATAHWSTRGMTGGCTKEWRLPAVLSLIARSLGPTWGPSGADRTQVGPMLAPGTLLSGKFIRFIGLFCSQRNQRAESI